MKKYLLCLLVFPAISGTSFSQQIIAGAVLTRSDSKPIAYANIGIANRGIGTISNEDGTYSFTLSERNLKDTIVFSAIGYRTRSIPLQTIGSNSLIVYLKEQPILLKEVTVAGRRTKNKTFELGNRYFQGGVIETDTMYAGASVALLIENRFLTQKHFLFPVYLEKARIRIFRNNLKQIKMRVRLYDVDSISGAPGKEFTEASMIQESDLKAGWLEFDLTAQAYVVSKPFFVAFEQILNRNDRTRIARGYQELKQKHPNNIKIDTVMIGGQRRTRQIFVGAGMDVPGVFIGIATSERAKRQFISYKCNTSLDQWKKVRGILSATVTVSNQRVSDSRIK